MTFDKIDSTQIIKIDKTETVNDLVIFLDQQLSTIDINHPVQLAIDTENLADFNLVVDYAKKNKIHFQLVNSDGNNVLTEPLAMKNAHLLHTYRLSLKQYGHFTVDTKDNETIITLKKDAVFGLNGDRPAFQELAFVLNHLNDNSRLKISTASVNQINISNINLIINQLAQKKVAVDITLVSANPHDFTLENQLFHDYHRYACRKKQRVLNQSLGVNDSILNLEPQQTKVRRTKQLLMQGSRIQTQIQHQVHHQIVHEVQTTDNVHHEQQHQQQQFQTRENQIAQQEHRMMQGVQDTNRIDIAALGRLICEDNLDTLVSSKHTLADIQTVWFNLVGRHAAYTENPENRITHVPEATFWLIFSNKEQFSDSIHFDNLPNGFGFQVKSAEKPTSSIFYYDNRLVNSRDTRTDSLLAPQIFTAKRVKITGTVGKFYPFFDGFNLTNYREFCTKHSTAFDQVYGLITQRIAAFKPALLEIIFLDDPDLKQHQLKINAAVNDFDIQNLKSLSLVLLAQGSRATVKFLLKIAQLKPIKLYDLFKQAFLDGNTNWLQTTIRSSTHKDELDAFQSIDYLLTMPADEKSWWQSLLSQHIKHHNHNDFKDLISAHKYFFEQVRTIDPTLQLPTPCPLKINHMKTALDRLLYVLKKSINPAEQARYLDDLDWGPQGVICGASRLGAYVLVTRDMKLTPNSGLNDWNKYAHYIPSFNPKKWLLSAKASGGTQTTQVEFLKCYQEQRLYGDKVPGTYLSPPGFYTNSYRQRKRYDMGERAFEAIFGPLYPTEAMKLLDRNRNGYLTIVTLRCFFQDQIEFASSLIDDPELQDDAICTRNNNLSYHIDYKKLLEITAKLSLYHNATTYFYRYIGTQAYSYQFSVYQQLIEAIQHQQLSPEAKTNSQVKLALLPLLAVTTTGARALTSDSDPKLALADLMQIISAQTLTLTDDVVQQTFDLHLLDVLPPKETHSDYNNCYLYLKNQPIPNLYFVRQNKLNCIPITNRFYDTFSEEEINNFGKTILTLDKQFIELEIIDYSQHGLYIGKLIDINYKINKLAIKPRLTELTALFKLTVNTHITNAIFMALETNNELMYQVLTNLTLHQTVPDNAHLVKFLMQLARFGLSRDTLLYKDITLLLASFMCVDEQHEVNHIHLIIRGLSDPLMLTALRSLLITVDVAQSQPISPVHVKALVSELNRVTPDDKDLENTIRDVTTRCLPDLRFADPTLAQSISTLIKALAPFANELETMIQSIKNQLDMVEIPGNNWLPSAHIKLIIKSLVDTLCEKITTLINHLKTITNDNKTSQTKHILDDIQALVCMLDDPFKNMTIEGMNPFTQAAVTTTINVFLTPIKTQILKEISRHLTNMACLTIETIINDFLIDDSLLDHHSEKNQRLSVQFKHFLIQSLPPIKGHNLTVEINQLFKQQERIEAFLKSLCHWHPKKRRDLLLLSLCRCGYFNKNSLPWLEDMAEIISSLRLSSQHDFQHIFESVIRGYHHQPDRQIIKNLLIKLMDVNIQWPETEFFALLDGVVDDTTQVLNALTLIEIKQRLQQQDTPIKRKAFGHLISGLFSVTFTDKPGQTSSLNRLKNLFDKVAQDSDTIASLVNFIFAQSKTNTDNDPFNSLDLLLQAIEQQNNTRLSDLLTILQGSCWQIAEEGSRAISEQVDLINQLSLIDEATFQQITALYNSPPSPGFAFLLQLSQRNQLRSGDWIKHYEQDPFGKRAIARKQYTLAGVSDFVAGMGDLITKQTLSTDIQHQLIKNFAYVIGCSNDYCLPVDHQLKPLNQFTRSELNAYLQACREKVSINPKDITSIIEGLAIFCEVMFRTSGKYPYFSQILIVITTLYFNGSSLLEIPTGQGKSIINALLAAMNLYFSVPTNGKPTHITVTSRNKLLINRDFKESVDFYHYLGMPVAFVTAATEKNYFEQPTIIYSTVSDANLYRSKLKMVNHFDFALKENQIVISDEIDSNMDDNSDSNFSQGDEDLYFNPLEWIYSLANQFVDDPLFLNTDIFEHEDINFFCAYVNQQAPEKYEQFKDQLTPFKLNQLLDSACVSKQLVENQDFVTRVITREVYGKQQIISEAHLLINHIEDTEATLSNGVQQSLHQRLNKQYQPQIEDYKQSNGRTGIPAFSCDNQIACIDSKNTVSFYQQFGKIIGTTGTAGTQIELIAAQHDFGFKNLLSIPPRRTSQLHYLSTLFSHSDAAWFFGPDTHLQAITKEITRHPHQPIMITCKNIDKVTFFYNALITKYPKSVQVIHAKNADDFNAFEDMVTNAKQPGMITIVTPLAGRGVDIKTNTIGQDKTRTNQQQRLDQLAEILLVIETQIDRFRNRRQIQGRTARDGKPGEVRGIFDLSDLAEFDTGIYRLSNAGRLVLLEKIMEKMDKEATLERTLINQVKTIAVTYQNYFDKLLKQASQPDRKNIIRAKAEFILQAETIWTELIAASDPDSQWPNPYIRYNQAGQLDETALTPFIGQYQTKLAELYCGFEQASDLDLTTGDQTLISNTQITSEINLAAMVCEPRPVNQLTIANAFVAMKTTQQHEPDFQSYLTQVENEVAFSKSLNFWIVNNPKLDQAIKAIAEQINRVRVEIFNQCEKKSQLQAQLKSMATVLQRLDNHQDLSAIGQLFDFYTLAYQDEYMIPAAIVDDESVKAIVALLKLVLDVTANKISDHDRQYLQTLSIKVLACQPLTPKQFFIKLSQLFNKANYQLTGTDAKSYLASINNFVNTLSVLPKNPEHSTEQVVMPDPRTIPLEIMVAEIKDFLTATSARLKSKQYFKHYRDEKSLAIDAFIEQISADNFVTNLLAQHAEQPLAQIFDYVNNDLKVDGKNLLTILAQNTRTGLSDNSTTSSLGYTKLRQQFSTTFSLGPNPCNHTKNYFLDKLITIETNLKLRQKNSGFFKDSSLYERKTAKLAAYIGQTKDLINSKNDGLDINSDVRSLLVKIENDADIYTNTSRFFKRPNNVTVVNDMRALYQEMVQPQLK